MATKVSSLDLIGFFIIFFPRGFQEESAICAEPLHLVMMRTSRAVLGMAIWRACRASMTSSAVGVARELTPSCKRETAAAAISAIAITIVRKITLLRLMTGPYGSEPNRLRPARNFAGPRP